ncbi:alpha-L-rhamnosidase N-terminal domain-containing protein [Zunongwangia sp. F260]|uniref:Alpha-L-rhamnosidase N-terminal domain-containing protein n=1 Tax=Autumnicola lenta TaxID=3075593 RepID=A0ABU3CNR6_9FLAO|nr:alpha-L-rhamnosidase N-terminal domain-containing protein [Zunongwangia sp. F260]MDT0648003.1 alpha-L-rhamnosidase N-terminal domain-containing protein [Zunongwangia sp. F260]
MLQFLLHHLHTTGRILFLFLFIGSNWSFKTIAQEKLNILTEEWQAKWITAPEGGAEIYGVYLFRKKINLDSVPSSFVIHVSGDNRYKLYVNNNFVSLGPAKGDVAHWNYETRDIAPFLKKGENIVAAKVWNEGDWKPLSHISLRTGFILQGDTRDEEIINTNNSWQAKKDNSYSPLEVKIPDLYYVAGPGEQIDMREHIKEWKTLNFDDSNWLKATELSSGVPKGITVPFVSANNWLLVPSTLPAMEMKEQRLKKVRRATGVVIPASFPAEKQSVEIPSNTEATILLDQTFLTNAYPTFIFSGGRDASVSLGYAEALYSNFPDKGNRDVIKEKSFIGRKDSLISDGSRRQVFTSLNWRTYRYVQVKISTRDQPLIIEDVFGTFTGYPFKYNARLEAPGNKVINEILDRGWRTARLCAVDTYMDTPYYEQLQYIGDTRIQAMVSLYNSGDDRLVKNALSQMDHSREPEGVTSSRHPSRTKQIIPPFSLWYIGMLHDYWMYGEDSEFIKEKLPGEREVLKFFRSYQQEDGSLKDVPYWSFTDWVVSKGWDAGVAPAGEGGNSAAYDLQLLWAYQLASEMEEELGMQQYSDRYKRYSLELKNTIQKKYWDDSRGLFADTPEKNLFSQHVNSLAILTGMVSGEDATKIGEKLLSNKDLAQASIYFRYYLHQALVKAGLGNDYMEWLDVWRENINLGLTTWAEKSHVSSSRSDSHAWGASPNIEFFRTLLGIDSQEPGFSKVIIKPHLGNLTEVSGAIPHPKGEVYVSYSKLKEVWNIEIILPLQISGDFRWKGKNYSLREGKNNFRLN